MKVMEREDPSYNGLMRAMMFILFGLQMGEQVLEKQEKQGN